MYSAVFWEREVRLLPGEGEIGGGVLEEDCRRVDGWMACRRVKRH